MAVRLLYLSESALEHELELLETAEATRLPMWQRMLLDVVKCARVFLSGRRIIMYIFGRKRKTRVTVALRVTHMHIVITCGGKQAPCYSYCHWVHHSRFPWLSSVPPPKFPDSALN
jgi:hypothetical protein